MVEGVRRRREHLENAKRPVEVAEWRDQYRAHAEVAARRQVHSRIDLCVGAQQHLTRPDALGRQSAISLQAAADIRSGAAGAGPADNLISSPQRDRSTRGACQGLGFFRDDADAGLQIDFGWIDLALSRGCFTTVVRGR